jgi:transcriptional regulatory protein LevR
MSKLLKETEGYLELERLITHEPGEFSDWELDKDFNQKYSDEVHEAEHYAFFEIKCVYRIDKSTGEVTYISWE